VRTVDTAAGCRDLLEAARATGRSVGLVPTMGALHAGHLSLMARARSECDVVAVSIFVNPLQFGDPEDIARYPRTVEADLALCAEAGVDIVFVPGVTEMYPSWPSPVPTTVSVSGVSAGWEGASRPGHFDGVATVVTKLFSIAGPCRAYFGEKDFQQLAVVRQLVSDLSLPVQVVGCPIVRETDGLALSSRNVRLSGDERRAAIVLSRALAAGRSVLERCVDGKAVRASAVSRAMRRIVATEPMVRLDYAAAVRDDDLVECGLITDPGVVRLLIAAEVGPVRLIDNCAAVAVAMAAEVPAAVPAAVPVTAALHAAPHRAARQLERIG
jgi:pantoate--beta-alanine ligase